MEPLLEGALATLDAELKGTGLLDSTNVIVFGGRGAAATIWKSSETSISLDTPYPDLPKGQMPPGFLAIDLIAPLQARDTTLGLFDPDDANDVVDWGGGEHPKKGNGLIAMHPSSPRVRVEAHGTYDLIYLPQGLSTHEVKRLGAQIIETLLAHDYVSGIFIDEQRLGRMRGTLPLSDIGMDPAAAPPGPAILAGFVSFTLGCDRPAPWRSRTPRSPRGRTCSAASARRTPTTFWPPAARSSGAAR